MEYRIIEITISRAELLLSMEEVAFLTSDALVGVDAKTRSSVQDIAQEGRIGYINNSINRAWAEMLHTLTAYTKKGIGQDVVSDNEYKENDYFVVKLRVPETFPINSVGVVMSTIQEFLINRTLASFFSIVKKNEAEMYMLMANDCLLRVKKYLNTRIAPTRIGLSVF